MRWSRVNILMVSHIFFDTHRSGHYGQGEFSKTEFVCKFYEDLTHIWCKLVNECLWVRVGLVVSTAVAGYALAPGAFSLSTLLLCSAGTCLMSASANALNQASLTYLLLLASSHNTGGYVMRSVFCACVKFCTGAVLEILPQFPASTEHWSLVWFYPCSEVWRFYCLLGGCWNNKHKTVTWYFCDM